MNFGLMRITVQPKRLCRLYGYLERKCSLSTKCINATNRIVYHSLCKNIHKNLALEEWIFENTDLSDTDVLLVWQSDPCVVIGRHQNPWTETNVPLLKEKSVTLARRSSGGGAVYHDHGNLNLSFMDNRARYDRRRNLQLVVDALTAGWDLDLSINERDDIIMDKCYKISGTAAKLSRAKSYHHFTLLHSVDRSKLSGMLASPLLIQAGDSPEKDMVVESRSTHSVLSSVENMQSRAPDMQFDQMLDAITAKFLEDSSFTCQTHVVDDPLDEQLYPGVSGIFERLCTWDWLYGKTPKFSVTMEMPAKSRTGNAFVLQVCVTIQKGCLESLVISLNDGTDIDLAYVHNIKGLSMKRENLKYFKRANLLFGSVFQNAYPRFDASNFSSSVQDSLSKLHEFL